MNLFQIVRNWAGYTSVELDDKQPIDFFEEANKELISLKDELLKAQFEFDDKSSSFEIKMLACDKLIEKGSDSGTYNKKAISEKLDRITENFFKKAQDLNTRIEVKNDEVIAIESEIITKAVTLTALLSEQERNVIQDQMTVWQETGLVKGEPVNSQTKAIVTVLDEIVKSDEYIEKGFFEGIRGGKVIGHTKSGKPIYDSHNNSSHKKFTHAEHMDAANIHDEHVSNATKSNDSKKMIHHASQAVGHREAAAKAHYMENYASDHHKEKMGLRKSEEDEGFEKAHSFEGHYANVIVRKGNRILLLKRGEEKVLAPGQWCLPGGHIDKGESIQQAAARELKEEANLDCDPTYLSVSSKAKCDNGKWAFYLNGWNVAGDVALLDGESQNAAWMTQEEWMDADLFFDLKDHLIAMEFPEFDVDKIPTISKAEDFFFELEKAGKEAAIGEVRTWGGIKYKKVAAGKWVPSKKERLAVADITSHAENTSSGQLKKVSQLHPDNHIRDAAKREIERRKADKEKKKESALAAKKPEAVSAAPTEPEKVKKKKKPDAVKYSPSEGLSSEHSKVEKTFGKKLNKDYDKSRSSYEKEFGHVLNTDNARELSDDYKKNKSELSAAVHEPASAFVKKMYEDKLAEKTPKGKKNLVYFTAGGTGAGKTSGLQGKEKSFHDKAHIVFDTNMNTMQSSAKKIDQALSSGKKVRINYVFRDPIDAFENGAVPRSLRIGRTVPIEAHIDTHLGALSTIQGLQEKYKGNKNVKIVVTDNSRGMGNAKRVPIESVKKWDNKYTSSGLRTQLHDINDRLYKEGKISEGHHKGFKG